MSQFFVLSQNVDQSTGNICITDEEYHHIVNVLRKAKGDQIKIFTEKGEICNTEIINIGKNEITSKIIEKIKAEETRKIIINLYQGILKPQNMNLVIQKSTELGVSNIIPIFTQFTVSKIYDIDIKFSHWQKVVLSAVKQSNLPYMPNIDKPISFNNIIETISQKALNILFYEKYGNKLTEVLSKIDKSDIKHINLFIGPEGGFAEQEVFLAKTKGVTISNLGQNILRSETASIVVVSAVLFWLNEL